MTDNSPLLVEVQPSNTESAQLDDLENNSKAVNSLELNSAKGIEMDNINGEKTLTSDVPMVDAANPTKEKSCFFDTSSHEGSGDHSSSETEPKIKPSGSLLVSNDSVALSDRDCPTDSGEPCAKDTDTIEFNEGSGDYISSETEPKIKPSDALLESNDSVALSYEDCPTDSGEPCAKDNDLSVFNEGSGDYISSETEPKIKPSGSLIESNDDVALSDRDCPTDSGEPCAKDNDTIEFNEGSVDHISSKTEPKIKAGVSLLESNDDVALSDKECPKVDAEPCIGDNNIIKSNEVDDWGSPSESNDKGKSDLAAQDSSSSTWGDETRDESRNKGLSGDTLEADTWGDETKNESKSKESSGDTFEVDTWGGETKNESKSKGSSGDTFEADTWGDETKNESKSKSSSGDARKASTWGDETKNESKSKSSSGDTWGASSGDQGLDSSWGESTVTPSKKSCTDWGTSFDSKETKSEPKAKTSSDDWGGSTWDSGGTTGGTTGGTSGGTSWGDSGGVTDWGFSSGTSDRGKSGGSGGKGCFKCGEEGHMSRECPKGGGGGGSRGKGCHKCGKEGHMAKDCSEPSLDADGKPRPPVYKPADLNENDESLFDTAAAGENFDAYDAMQCSVSGEDVPKNPERYETFEEAFTSETILNGLKQSKIKKPTPIQKYGMRIVMAGRDLMACAQTGSGKTLAFVLPILQDLFNDKDLRSGYGESPAKPKAIIVTPTRELAIQIYKEAYKYSRGSIVKVQIIYGGTSVGHQRAKLSEGAHIIVGTTGRLLDFLDKNYYNFSELKYFVLDEADRMIDQGFIPDVRKMIIHPTMPPREKRQTLMFSATFANAVQKVASEFLVTNYLFLTVGILGAANSDVSQTLLKVEKFSKRNKLLEILKECSNNDRTMIFVESKKNADFLASFLSQSDYRATSIHGDRYQRQREEALEDLKSGKFPILVATSVASRGLDIKDVRHVINYDLPKEIDDYIHRIGRTGRVGNKGKATSFYDPEADKALAAKIVNVIENAKQTVPDWLREESSYESGNGIAFGGVDYRGEGGNKEYQDLDASKESFDIGW